MAFFPAQSKKKKIYLWPKIYVLQCTLYTLMNVHLGSKKNLSQMFQNFSELYLAVSPHSLQAALREGWTGYSDL